MRVWNENRFSLRWPSLEHAGLLFLPSLGGVLSLFFYLSQHLLLFLRCFDLFLLLFFLLPGSHLTLLLELFKAESILLFLGDLLLSQLWFDFLLAWVTISFLLLFLIYFRSLSLRSSLLSISFFWFCVKLGHCCVYVFLWTALRVFFYWRLEIFIVILSV